jgi:hypothetical protein
MFALLQLVFEILTVLGESKIHYQAPAALKNNSIHEIN